VPRKRKIYTPDAPTPAAPYSQAMEANGFIFVTGQVSRDPHSGEFVDGLFGDQLHLCIKNLEAILAAGGCGLNDIVKLTIFMTSHDDLDEMNAILRQYFPTDPPARSSFGVGFLWKKCKVMVEAIAATK